jgi:ABC-type transport system involved in multi-copper enzyme maturation permease subunit
MSRYLTLVVLALRELWISFRLLAAIGVLLATSLPVLLIPRSLAPGLPGSPPDRLAWLAIVTAASLALVSALAATSLAGERARGSAAWLTLRAVPRGTVLLAWLTAVAIVLGLGLLPAAVVVWATGGPEVTGPGATAYVAVYGSVYLLGLLGIAAGLLLGTLLRPMPAALAALLLVGTALELAATGTVGGPPLPGTALGVLAELDSGGRPIASALQGAGSALALAAALLVLAMAALQRADL